MIHESLQTAVARVGADLGRNQRQSSSFQFYSGGIYWDVFASSVFRDHFALVVGYGPHGIFGDYWLIKNCWTAWGDKGYVKIARNKGNHCGIASAAGLSRPEVGARALCRARRRWWSRAGDVAVLRPCSIQILRNILHSALPRIGKLCRPTNLSDWPTSAGMGGCTAAESISSVKRPTRGITARRACGRCWST